MGLVGALRSAERDGGDPLYPLYSEGYSSITVAALIASQYRTHLAHPPSPSLAIAKNMANSSQPFLTIGIAAYENPSALEELILSFISIKCDDVQLLIVDDCSSDNTYSLAKSYERRDSRILVTRNESNQWPCHVLRLIAISEGEYCMDVRQDELLIAENIPGLVSQLRRYRPDYAVSNSKGHRDLPFYVGSFLNHPSYRDLRKHNHDGQIFKKGLIDTAFLAPHVRQVCVLEALLLIEAARHNGTLLQSNVVTHIVRSVPSYDESEKYQSRLGAHYSDVGQKMKELAHYLCLIRQRVEDPELQKRLTREFAKILYRHLLKCDMGLGHVITRALGYEFNKVKRRFTGALHAPREK